MPKLTFRVIRYWPRKLQSSLTLMKAAGGGETVQMALDTFFEGEMCARTNAILDDG